MKKHFIALLFCCLLGFLLVGCSTANKLTTTTKVTTKVDEKRIETTTADNYAFIDTTKKAGYEVNYTKIEYYPPEPKKAPTQLEGAKVWPANQGAKEAQTKPPNVGAIKSIETYSVKKTEEKSGVSKKKEAKKMKAAQEIKSDTSTQAETQEKPAADTYRWRYIFYILITVTFLGIGLYFYLKKKNVLSIAAGFINKIIGFVKMII